MIKTSLSDSVVHTQVDSAINHLIKIKIFFLIAIIFNIVTFTEGPQMENLTRRFEILSMSKTRLSDRSALFETLNSKNLGNAAIEECLKKLHHNQNVSEKTTKPFRKGMLGDKIKDIKHKLDMNEKEMSLLLDRIEKFVTTTEHNSETMTEEASKNAKMWENCQVQTRKTTNLMWNRLKKRRNNRIKNLIKKYKKPNKNHTKKQNMIPKNGEEIPRNSTPPHSLLKPSKILKKSKKNSKRFTKNKMTTPTSPLTKTT